MARKVRNKLYSIYILLILGLPLNAQITNQATSGLPSPQLAGNGSPVNNFTCNLAAANLSYIQLDATNGRLWLCDYSTGAWVWDHITAPILGTTISIGGTLLLLNGIVSGTATVTGATPGQNCLATRSDGALPAVGTIIDCAVTATNTVTVRLTALISSTPTASTYNVKVFQ